MYIRCEYESHLHIYELSSFQRVNGDCWRRDQMWEMMELQYAKYLCLRTRLVGCESVSYVRQKAATSKKEETELYSR